MKLEAGFKSCFGFVRNTKLWPGFLENSTGPNAGGSSFSVYVCVSLAKVQLQGCMWSRILERKKLQEYICSSTLWTALCFMQVQPLHDSTRSLMVEKSNVAPSIPYLLTGNIAFSTNPWMPICCIKAISLTSLSGEEFKCDLNDQKSHKDNQQDYKGKSYRTSVIALNRKPFSSHSSE